MPRSIALRDVTFKDVGGRVTNALVDNAGALPEAEERLHPVVGALAQKESV